ncbi:unnamed protein product, partial [Ectocarpus sp. 12 AP-2014]
RLLFFPSASPLDGTAVLSSAHSGGITWIVIQFEGVLFTPVGIPPFKGYSLPNGCQGRGQFPLFTSASTKRLFWFWWTKTLARIPPPPPLFPKSATKKNGGGPKNR